MVIRKFYVGLLAPTCLLMLVLTAIGCTTLPKALDPVADKQSCRKDHEIYIISHGWHAGLAIKAIDLNKIMPELPVRFPNSSYYEIGCGDAGFYQSNQITTGLTLQAVFGSTGSVLHVVGLQSNPFDTFKKSEVRLLSSDDKNYQTLLLYISSSFKPNQNNEVILENHGIYGDSQFYTGIGANTTSCIPAISGLQRRSTVGLCDLAHD